MSPKVYILQISLFSCVKFILRVNTIITRCTRGVRVVFSVTRMRSSNSARMNKFDITTEKIGSVHKTVFEIVAPHNVDNWVQLLTLRVVVDESKQCAQIHLKKIACYLNFAITNTIFYFKLIT